MLINKPGAEFLYNGITYRIGDVIIGSDQSEYAGLIGSIFEIRDGSDKETENDTPDIYCSFDPPVLPTDIAKVKAVFSDLYGTQKILDDICFDMVIMAPEMITVPGQSKTERGLGCKRWHRTFVQYLFGTAGGQGKAQ